MAWPQTHSGPPRNRFVAFRVLAVLQFGKHYTSSTGGFMEVREGGEMIIHSLARLGKKLHMRTVSLREALEWLQEAGYLSGIWWVTGGKAVRLTLTQPTNIRGVHVPSTKQGVTREVVADE